MHIKLDINFADIFNVNALIGILIAFFIAISVFLYYLQKIL